MSVFRRFASRNGANAPDSRSACRTACFMARFRARRRFLLRLLHLDDVVGAEHADRRPLVRIQLAREVQRERLESARREEAVRAVGEVRFAETDSPQLAIERPRHEVTLEVRAL